jgi:predicted HTH domain antitoxin
MLPKDMRTGQPLFSNWFLSPYVKSINEINKKEAIQAYRDGRMTIRQCANMLGVDYFEMNEILNGEGVPIVPDLTEDKETLLSTLKDSLAKGFEPK